MNLSDPPTSPRPVGNAALERLSADTPNLCCHGTVHHARLRPQRHAFRYPVWMLLVDLEGRPTTPWWLRPLVRLDGDHLMAARTVRRHLDEAGIKTKGVRVLALTQPGALGHSFNPVNFYFCECEGALMALLLQVTNTPWGEEHCYVLDGRGRGIRGRHRFEFPKAFHVSPFLSMRGSYRLRLDIGDNRLRIALRLSGGSAPFLACLTLCTTPFTTRSVLAAGIRRPAQNALTLVRIYWQAARLFGKRTPFFAHPRQVP